jgi:leucyl aminopeptidase (aminopeptidase T)
MPRRRPRPADRALARVVLERALGLGRGDAVTVEAWSTALPWARALVLEARTLGIVPTLVVEDEEAFFRSIAEGGAPVASGPLFAPVGPGAAYVYLGGPADYPRLLGLPPEELRRVARRHAPAWQLAARRRRVRAVRLAVADASPAAAGRFGVDLAGWQRELVRASRVDPGRLARSGTPLLRALVRGRRLVIRHANGTDLSVRRSSTAPWVDDGRPRRPGEWTRIPSGRLVVPLAPRATEGTWEANRPSFDRYADPSRALGGRLSFARGRVVEFAFERGGERFAAGLARGGAGARQASLLSIGLNREVRQAPEVLDLAAGMVGLWLGGSVGRPGIGRHEATFLTTLAGADVELDGRPLLIEGRLRKG